MRDINADIWILTETNEIVVPGSDYHEVASTPVEGNAVADSETIDIGVSLKYGI